MRDPLFYLNGNPKYRVAPDGCWIWTAGMNNNGYGAAYFRGHLMNASRASFIARVGEVPDGLQIDHLCRNRKCVNPEHLEMVSRRTNIRRGLRAKLTEEKVSEIRRAWSAGGISQSELGRRYHIHSSVICEIVNGKIWLPA